MTTFHRGVTLETAGRGKRFYIWHKEQFWSVTSILQAYPKPILVNWAKKVTAEYAVENIEQVYAVAQKDPQGAIDLVKGAAYRQRDKAADIGSDLHDAMESHVLGRPRPPVLPEREPWMASFYTFLEEFDPTFLAVEAPVISRQRRYAGTLDNIMEISTDVIPACTYWGPTPVDRPWRILGDYKTGSGVFPEHVLQQAAYRHAEAFIGMPDDTEEPLPEVDGAAIIHIRPEGYELLPIDTSESVFEYFLFVMQVFRYTEEISKRVIGTPLVSDRQLELRLERSVAGAGDSPFPPAPATPIEEA